MAGPQKQQTSPAPVPPTFEELQGVRFAPPPETASWWRPGPLGDEIAAALAWLQAMGQDLRTVGSTVGRQLGPSPEMQAYFDQLQRDVEARLQPEQQRRAAQTAAVTGPMQRFFGSEPVRRFGEALHEQYAPAWTPPPEVAAAAEQLKQEVSARAQAGRAGLRESLGNAPIARPFETLLGLQSEAIPNFATDVAVDTTSPLGALSNVNLPLGKAAPFLAKALPFAERLAAGPWLPWLPGTYSRLQRYAEAVGKKGVPLSKFLKDIKEYKEEAALRKVPELVESIRQGVTTSGDPIIGRDVLQAHLAENPLREFSELRLGEPVVVPHMPFQQWTHTLDAAEAVDELRTQYPQMTLPDLRDLAYQNYLQRPVTQAGSPTRWTPYTFGAGQSALPEAKPEVGSHRESLYRLAPLPKPPRVVKLEDQIKKIRDDWTARGFVSRADVPPEEHAAYQALKTELATESEAYRKAVEFDDFSSGHYASAGYGSDPNYKNYLFHVRWNLRKLGDKLGQFIDEFQSDRFGRGQQSGMRYGAKTPQDQELLEAARIESAAATRQLGEYWDPIERQVQAPDFTPFSFEDWLANRGPMEHGMSDWYLQPGNENALRREYEYALQSWERNPDVRRRRLLEQMKIADPQYRKLYKSHAAGRKAAEDISNRIYQASHPGNYAVASWAPYEGAWEDLAFKQRLWQIAHDPQLEWLGFTGAKMQADRYGAVTQQKLRQVRYNPTTGELIAVPGDVSVTHPTFEEDLRILRRPKVKPEELGHDIGQELQEQLLAQPLDPEGFHTLTGDFTVPSKGMLSAYDKEYIRKLEKIVRGLGWSGSVEKRFLPATKRVLRDIQGFGVQAGGAGGYMESTHPTREAAERRLETLRSYGYNTADYQVVPHTYSGYAEDPDPQYFWHLAVPDALKQLIREKGFPALALLGLLGGSAAAAAGQGQDVGAPPPVFPSLSGVRYE